jgi:uncharacterized protein YggE
MRRTAALLVFGSALLAAAPASAQQMQMHPPGPPVIVTRGEATIKRAPDQAWVNIAAEARAGAPSDAQRQAADAMRSVQSAVSRAGIPNNAVRTVSYSIQPDIEWVSGRSRVRGYIARNEIEVRVDDLDELAGVIDAAGSSGATSMSGLRFDVRDREEREREALKVAVENAMARARAIAEGARATLAEIVRIDEQSEIRPPMPVYRMTAEMSAAAQNPTPINPGDLEIRAVVTLTIAIR